MVFQRKYGNGTVTASHIRIPMIKRGACDFAVGADWTPAAGDVKISRDGAAPLNIATLPSAVTVGNSAFWEFPLSASELTCKQIVITIADAAPKAVEDNIFVVETFGNVAAMMPVDFSDTVRMGMTALPNAAAASNGGIPTCDAGNRIAGIQGTKNTLDSLNDLSASQVENAVLDADVSTHHTSAGSVGERINAAGSAGDPWSAALPGSYGAGTAGSILANGIVSLTTNLGAVKAKTDNLPTNPAAAGDQMALDFSQPVPTSNTAQTVGDALNAARAQGFGTLVTDPLAVPPTITLFAPDDVTPVRVFHIDNAMSPSQRT